MKSDIEKEREAKELLAKYKDDDSVILVEDEYGMFATPKFKEEDWDKLNDMIDNHPLFSKNIDVENNELLQALQAIKYDETAEKILENLYVRLDNSRKKLTRS
jgi:hypothetical protein